MIFIPGTPDPLGSKAGSRAGIMSSLIGIAARQSIETGLKVKISDLVTFPKYLERINILQATLTLILSWGQEQDSCPERL